MSENLLQHFTYNYFLPNRNVEVNISGNSRTQWTTEQIRLLLHLYEKHCTALDNSEISNRTFWRYLNEGLKNKGHNFTVEQCKTKINNMKKMYKDIKDHNAQSGNDRKTYEHYEVRISYYYSYCYYSVLYYRDILFLYYSVALNRKFV